MQKKQLRFDPGDRSSSFGDDNSLIDHCHNDHSDNLGVTIKHIRTKDIFSTNEDMYRSFLRKIMQSFFSSILKTSMLLMQTQQHVSIMAGNSKR
ncbi:MAG: hypothetical protein AB9861_15520 [Methanosarcina sp.]